MLPTEATGREDSALTLATPAAEELALAKRSVRSPTTIALRRD